MPGFCKNLLRAYPVEPIAGALLGLFIGWGLFGIGMGALVGYFVRVFRQLLVPTLFQVDIDGDTTGDTSGDNGAEAFQGRSGSGNGEGGQDPYRILGVSSGDATDEIRRVYRTLASSFHPDSMASLSEFQRKEAEEAFVRIRMAWEFIARERGIRP